MGADYVSEIVSANDIAELRQKYSEIVDYCLYVDGHGGYTGTFAEKRGLRVMRDTDFPPCMEEEAYRHCHDNNEKWGPSFAYWLGGTKWYIGGWCSC